ncbi:two-component response regulator yesN [Paenibacillus sp. JCM 10914]|nr:two-component response regulator yesN [Paenibacillus sp. JCM 10914]
MIVDDEPSNIQGLVRYIEWSELGFDAPVTEGSGEEALETLAQSNFDILISDVAMPGMNGIELVAKAKEIYPHLQVLMISGYDEFEFVRDAIDVGAQAYVLKPLKLDEVANRLSALRTTIEKRRMLEDQMRELEQTVFESRKLTEERFVSDLIEGIAQSDEMLSSWNRLMDLPSIEEGYQILVFGIDHYLSSGKEAIERVLLGSGFKNTVEIGLAQMDFKLFLSQIAPDEIVALHLNPSPVERARIEKQLAFIQDMMREQHDAEVTIGCSRMDGNWEATPLLYHEVKFMMAQSRLMADGQIARTDQFDSQEFKEFRLKEELVPGIMKLLESGDGDMAKVKMNRIFDLFVTNESFSFSYVQAFGISFLSEMIRALKWNGGPDMDVNLLMWRRLLDCSNTRQIIGILIEFIDHYMLFEKKEQNRQQRNLIRKIADFIKEHMQENWTVKQLAEQFNLNASYLSVLFKKEMGVTISEFVQETRISLARELLQDPNIRIYEVADRVGIQTSAYFTYLFKKIVGCTPQDYRDYRYTER